MFECLHGQVAFKIRSLQLFLQYWPQYLLQYWSHLALAIISKGHSWAAACVIAGSAPTYLNALVRANVTPRMLRSSNERRLALLSVQVRQSRLSSFVVPRWWFHVALIYHLGCIFIIKYFKPYYYPVDPCHSEAVEYSLDPERSKNRAQVENDRNFSLNYIPNKSVSTSDITTICLFQ